MAQLVPEIFVITRYVQKKRSGYADNHRFNPLRALSQASENEPVTSTPTCGITQHELTVSASSHTRCALLDALSSKIPPPYSLPLVHKNSKQPEKTSNSSNPMRAVSNSRFPHHQEETRLKYALADLKSAAVALGLKRLRLSVQQDPNLGSET